MIFGWLKRNQQLEEARRAATFAAGYRTAQIYIFQTAGYPPPAPLDDWEEGERQNAIKHGVTVAKGGFST
jgi:hypothetical protein